PSPNITAGAILRQGLHRNIHISHYLQPGNHSPMQLHRQGSVRPQFPVHAKSNGHLFCPRLYMNIAGAQIISPFTYGTADTYRRPLIFLLLFPYIPLSGWVVCPNRCPILPITSLVLRLLRSFLSHISQRFLTNISQLRQHFLQTLSRPSKGKIFCPPDLSFC